MFQLAVLDQLTNLWLFAVSILCASFVKKKNPIMCTTYVSQQFPTCTSWNPFIIPAQKCTFYLRMNNKWIIWLNNSIMFVFLHNNEYIHNHKYIVRFISMQFSILLYYNTVFACEVTLHLLTCSAKKLIAIRPTLNLNN